VSHGTGDADGINWSDSSAIWANTNQTQAYDPMSKTKPPTTVLGRMMPRTLQAICTPIPHRRLFALDIQLPNALMFAAYNSKGGVQLAPDTA